MNKKISLFIVIFLVLNINIVYGDLTNNLVGYFNFDDINNNPISGISSFRINNLTTGITKPIMGVPGLRNNASNFTGTSSMTYINVSLTFSDNLTINTWFNISNTASANKDFLDTAYSSGRAFKLGYSSSTDCSYSTWGICKFVGGWSSWASGASIDLNKWQMVTYVFNHYNTTHTELKLYINGTFYAETNLTFDKSFSDLISMSSLRQTAITGIIDEQGFWNRTLNATEITQLYNNGAGYYFDFFPVVINKSGLLNKTHYEIGTTNVNWSQGDIYSTTAFLNFGNVTNRNESNLYRMCYQETTNASNINDGNCGLSYTGSYTYTGNWWSGALPELAYDGNWGTSGYSYSGEDSSLFINYTKPIESNNNSKWQVKFGDGINTITNNYSIPFSCWNQTKLSFNLTSSYTALPKVIGSCYNGTDYQNIFTDGTYDRVIYEEAMYWNTTITNTLTVSKSISLPIYVNNFVAYITHIGDVTFNSSMNNGSFNTQLSESVGGVYTQTIHPYQPDIGSTVSFNNILLYSFILGSSNSTVYDIKYDFTPKQGYIYPNIKTLLLNQIVGFNASFINNNALGDNFTVNSSTQNFGLIDWGNYNVTIFNNAYINSCTQNNFIFTSENLSIPISNNNAYCYQESANTSNQVGTDTQNCGLDYNGVYTYTGVISQGSFADAIDGIWNYPASYMMDLAGNVFYVNYTKPINSIGAIHTVKSTTAFNTETTGLNNTVPSDCFNTNSKLQLKIYSIDLGGGSYIANTSCYNGSNWKDFGTMPYRFLYEEGIFWNFPTCSFYDGYLNITATNLTGGTINNFTATVNYNGSSLSSSTTSGKTIYNITKGGNYTLGIDAVNYALMNVTQVFNNVYNNYTFLLLPENSINITIIDGYRGNLIYANTTVNLLNTSNHANILYTFYVNATQIISGINVNTYDIQFILPGYQTKIYPTIVVASRSTQTLIANLSDSTAPSISFSNININLTSNKTVLNKNKYNFTYNITYNDYNLFQVEMYINCSIDGVIHNWSFINLNVTNTTYNKYDTFNLSKYSLQKCIFYTASSDTHTSENIPVYQKEILDNGVTFLTENDNTVQILADESVNAVSVKKLYDRETFKFDFTDSDNIRTFTLLSDNTIYYIQGSEYPAHFVIWNEETRRGNWVDFVDKLNSGDIYVVNKVNDYEYNVIITTQTNNNKLEFSSIGGTLFNNITGEFYLGGDVNITGYNQYNNSVFNNYSYNLFTINSYPGLNVSGVASTANIVIDNVTNGSYGINFTHAQYFPQNYNFSILNNTYYINYSTYQSILNAQFQRVTLDGYLYNVSYRLFNINTGQNITANTGDNLTTIFYINAGNYTMFWNKTGYTDMSENFTVTYQQTFNHVFTTYFAVTFNLYDEKTLGVFNISGTSRVQFQLFCPTSTVYTLVNATNFTLPITCNYRTFRFIVDYGATTYYRSFILIPDNLNDVKIYLLDLLTTPYVFDNLVADDLLNRYINARFYVLKIIGNETIQITADYVDIEQKITAYLMQNNQYILQLVSDNLAVYTIGVYTSDVSGTKNIKLYEIGTFDPSSLDWMPYYYRIFVDNSTGDQIVNVQYYDLQNDTNSVSVNIYLGDVIVQTLSSIGQQNVVFTYNATALYNTTLPIYVELTASRNSPGFNNVKILIHEYTKIRLAIIDYVGQNLINWIIIVLLGVLALTATIQTANYVALALVFLGALFAIFGWLVISASVLALAGLVALVSLLKEGERNS